jgi:SAM-dependent methyltransferase
MRPYRLYRDGRIEYYQERADAAFWEAWWSSPAGRLKFKKEQPLFAATVFRYNAPGSLILEAGCGLAHYVYSLRHSGYRVVGVDFARQALRAAKAEAPELPLAAADVERLPFADGTFDGYWSGGLIEHFRHGFDGVLGECHRVLKPGGIGYVAFPYMNSIRKLKGLLGLYGRGPVPDGLDFYQFALDPGATRRAWEARGFERVGTAYLFPHPALKALTPRALRPLTDPFHHHSIMLILRKVR